MSKVLKLDINTELIKTVVPVHVAISYKNRDIILEGVRYYDVDKYIKLSSGMNKVYDYLITVIFEWSTYLLHHYVFPIDKDDPIINVIEDDINDFMVAFFEAMKEICKQNEEVVINLPEYPINYFKLSLTNNGSIKHTYIQPDDPEGYYIKRLERMNKHRLAAMKKSVLRTLA